jgi:hypothetical protein
MPITKSNWGNFFQGAFAEHHVCSLFYLYGYETHKVSPDIGIDLLVTNVARTRFLGEAKIIVEVQVKSAISDASGAMVAMDSDELDYLCTGDDRYCVFVIFTGLRAYFDPMSFERGDDPDAANAVDRDIWNMWEHRASVEGRKMKSRGELSLCDFSDTDITVFWLHSSHMRRLRDGQKFVRLAEGRFGLKIQKVNSIVYVEDLPLIAELRNLRFVVGKCKAHSRLREGHMTYDDY